MKLGLSTLLFLGVLVIACLGFYFLGDSHAVEHMSIKRVTPTQAAEAMRLDKFYSSYRENTLVMSGQVKSVSGRQVSLMTDSAYGVDCELTAGSVLPQTNQKITVLAEGGPAQREERGVRLVDCVRL